MDLDRCPRCQAKWSGSDFCGACGFVPIGAGLKGAPKKKKRRSRYVEPGSARSFFSLVVAGGIGFGCYKYQPWQNDWAVIRYLLGQGHVRKVDGDWDIVKAVSLKPGKPTVIASHVSGGYFKFANKENVKVCLFQGDDEMEATGLYQANGRKITVVNLRTQDGAAKLPTSMVLLLTWQGPDTVIAAISPNELLYMQRRKAKSGLAGLVQLKVKYDGTTAVPDGMRSPFDKMKKGISNEE